MNSVTKYGPGISVAAVIVCIPYGIMLIATGQLTTGIIDVVLGLLNGLFLFTTWRTK